MKGPVELLDWFRLSLLENADHFLVLNVLLRYRSATTDELCEWTGKTRPVLRALTRELYQAGWVHSTPHDRLFLRSRTRNALATFGTVDVAIESLIRELADSDLDREALRSCIKSEGSSVRKQHWLGTLQAALWTATVFPETTDGVWKRVLRAVLHAAAATVGTSNWLVHSPEGPAEERADVSNFRRFCREAALPDEPEAREVTLQGMLILVILACFDREPSPFVADIRNEKECLKTLQTEYGSVHSDFEQRVGRLFISCVDHYTKAPNSPGDWWAEIESHLDKAKDSSYGNIPEINDDSPLRLLLPPLEEKQT